MPHEADVQRRGVRGQLWTLFDLHRPRELPGHELGRQSTDASRASPPREVYFSRFGEPLEMEIAVPLR